MPKLIYLLARGRLDKNRELMIDGMMYHQNVFATATNDKDRIC